VTQACEQVLERLGQGALPPELQAHVRDCPACAELVATFSGLGPAASPAPSDAAMEQARTRSLQELRAQPVAKPWWRDALGILGVCAVMAVVAVVLLGRKHGLVLNQAPWTTLVVVSALLVAVITCAAFVMVAPRGGGWLRAGLIVLALETAGVVVLAGSGLDVSVSFVKAGIPCMVSELGISVVPLGLALWFLTRSAYQPARAFAAGLGTGAVGILALHLHCACGTAAHLFTFHVLPWLLLSALAVLLRSRMPTRSFAP